MIQNVVGASTRCAWRCLVGALIAGGCHPNTPGSPLPDASSSGNDSLTVREYPQRPRIPSVLVPSLLTAFAERIDNSTAGVRVRLPMLFVNRSTDTAFLSRCYRLERWSGGAWQLAFSPVCRASRLLVVAPNLSLMDTLLVAGAVSGTSIPFWQADSVEGIYQLLPDIYPRRDASQLLPDSIRASNAFEIRCSLGQAESTLNDVFRSGPRQIIGCR